MPADPGELTSDDLRPGREHCTEHADDNVERTCLIWEIFRIALLEPDVERLTGRTSARLDEKVGGDIDPGDDGTCFCCRNSEITAAACNIQYLRARLKLQAGYKFIRGSLGQRCDPRIVSRHPRGSSARFEGLKVGDLSCGHGSVPSLAFPLWIEPGMAEELPRQARRPRFAEQSGLRRDYPLCVPKAAAASQFCRRRIGRRCYDLNDGDAPLACAAASA